VVADVGDAQSWNSYSYVGNNPLRYVDPSGFCKVPHEPDCDCCGEGGVGGKSGGGSGGGSDGEGSVPQTIPPHPGDGTSNGEAPATGPGVPPHANGGHSDMPGAQRSSNGAGQGGPPIKYVDLGEIEVTPCNIGDDYSNCASGPEAQPEDTGAEIGAAAFDWFIDDGIGTTLKFTSWGTYSLIEPEGGLGPWVRVEAGSLLENDFGLLENDFGELGKSSTYGSASLGLDVLTIIATFRLGSGPPAPKSLPVQGQVQGVWFSSFDTLKANIPSGSKTWHHIVEQSAGFPTWLTNNIGNVIRLDPITHRMISKFYSTSKAPFTNGKVVRKWLKGRSFDEHYETGMWVLRQFGVVP
jgi:hypothetical protein